MGDHPCQTRAVNTNRPGTWTDPRERADRPATIQLPPLSSSKTGPPQRLVRQAVTPTTPRLQHAALKRRTPPGGHDDQLVDGYRPGLTPRNLVKNLSQGPIIHRPHPHQKQQRLLEFLAPFRPPGGGQSSTRPPPGPEHAAARSVRGRQPFKHETARAPYCGCVFRDPSVCERGVATPPTGPPGMSPGTTQRRGDGTPEPTHCPVRGRRPARTEGYRRRRVLLT